jgi:dihydroorotate dehydrogenase
MDIIASGGIQSGADLAAFRAAGARAAMVYSALIFRGPLAPALILREASAAPDA